MVVLARWSLNRITVSSSLVIEGEGCLEHTLGMYYLPLTIRWHCRLISLFLHPSRHSEKAMAPHSSTLTWKIPWMEEPGRLQSMGSRRVRHGWATSLSLFTFMHWRRKWQPTPVFLPGESQGRGRTESDRLKWLSSSSSRPLSG